MPFPPKVAPRVVVKFRNHIELPYVDGAEVHLPNVGIGTWNQLVVAHPGIRLVRLFTTLTPPRIRDIMDRARQRDATYRPVNLLTYFAIDCPAHVNPRILARDLCEWNSVQAAYVEAGPAPPPVDPGDDPRFPNQGYLAAAPDGIDAIHVWSLPGGDGGGMGYMDLEQGWTLDHDDLIDAAIGLHSGVNYDFHGHGTAVLGEISAVDNDKGCVGIAPRARGMAISQWRTATIYNTADAILSAVAALRLGDVLLLEAQTGAFSARGFVPVEVELAVFDAIRVGVAMGIVVVEAGANGSEDLDNFSDSGKLILKRGDPDFRDSGAILVGAATSTHPHQRMWFSNYGSRIDCYGWGENVDTTGDGYSGKSVSAYTNSFAGTSSASPIIVGAALLLQSVVLAKTGTPLPPERVRAILADPALGTPSANPAADRLGVMPNLKLAIEAALPAVTPPPPP